MQLFTSELRTAYPLYHASGHEQVGGYFFRMPLCLMAQTLSEPGQSLMVDRRRDLY